MRREMGKSCVGGVGHPRVQGRIRIRDGQHTRLVEVKQFVDPVQLHPVDPQRLVLRFQLSGGLLEELGMGGAG